MSVKLVGADELIKGLQKLTGNFSPEGQRTMYSTLGNIVLRDVRLQFEIQGKPSKWQTWKKTTEKARQKAGRGNQILTATGDLRQTIQLNLLPNGFEVGTPTLYGKWLQFGTRYMVARPFFQTDDINKSMNEGVEIIVERMSA